MVFSLKELVKWVDQGQPYRMGLASSVRAPTARLAFEQTLAHAQFYRP